MIFGTKPSVKILVSRVLKLNGKEHVENSVEK
jgi:hypothetical protein